MPNGYGYFQVYVPVARSELLTFMRSMERGRSKYVLDAIELKRAMDGEETLIVAVVRRVVREELTRILSRMPKNAAPNFEANFESSESNDEADLADFVGRNQF